MAGEKPIEVLADGQKVFARNAAGQPVCGSPRNRNRPPCQQTRITHNGRCRMHGGTSTGPHTTGKTPQRFRGKLGTLIAQAAQDSRLLDMNQPVEVLLGILHRKIELLEDADSPEFRKRAVELVREFCADQTNVAMLTTLVAHLEAGANETMALESVERTAVLLSDKQEAVKKQDLARQTALPLRQLASLLSLLAEDVQRYADPGTAKRIVMAWDLKLRVFDTLPLPPLPAKVLDVEHAPA